MTSFNKGFEPSQKEQIIKEWIPQQLEDDFGLEMPSAEGSNGGSKNSNPGIGNNFLTTKDSSFTKTAPDTHQTWIIPEIEFSDVQHMVGNYGNEYAFQEKPEPDLSEMLKHQKLISKTEEQCNQRIQEAEQQADQIRVEAQKQGLAAANAEADRLLRVTRTIAEEMHAWRESVIAQSEETVINLVLDIGRTLFGSGFALDQNQLQEVYSRAIRDAKNLGNLVIRVHPDDADLVETRQLQEQAHFSQNVKLTADSSIKRGGCFIEGDHGQIDARVETQFEVISEKLTDVMAVQTAQKYSNPPANPDESSGILPDHFGI